MIKPTFCARICAHLSIRRCRKTRTRLSSWMMDRRIIPRRCSGSSRDPCEPCNFRPTGGAALPETRGSVMPLAGWRHLWTAISSFDGISPPITQASIQNLLRKEDERAKSAVYFYRKHPTAEVRLLIQATSVHRLLYSIQSGFGLLTPTNVEHIAARLRRSGRNGLADLVMRGVLNRHYVQRLDDELAQSRHRG